MLAIGSFDCLLNFLWPYLFRQNTDLIVGRLNLSSCVNNNQSQ